MKNLLIASWFLLVTVMLAQDEREQKDISTRPAPIHFEINSFPIDSSISCFISYRIPYNNLVFVKDGEEYSGGLSITFEIYEKERVISREISSRKAVAFNYEETLSEIKYLEGIVNVHLDSGYYQVQPVLNINNMKQTIKLRNIPLKIKGYDSYEFIKPLVVHPELINCDGENNYQLVNFNGSIPYSNENYDLILLIHNQSVDNLTVNLIQGDSLILTRELKSLKSSQLIPVQCGENIILEEKYDSNYNFFRLDNFSSKLNEGKVTVKFIHESIDKNEFELDVLWIDKPKALYNPEFAIEMLEIIEDKKIVSKMLDKPEDEYVEVLNNYWNKMDPDNETGFNEIMFEFYSRADYAAKEFGTVNENNGILSDRGKIYIKYGNPDDIERLYSEQDEIIEIWHYKKINKKFVFSDQSGLGNYILMN